jgi:hypothetical protein
MTGMLAIATEIQGNDVQRVLLELKYEELLEVEEPCRHAGSVLAPSNCKVMRVKVGKIFASGPIEKQSPVEIL